MNMHHLHHHLHPTSWGGATDVVPFEEEEVPGYQDNLREPISSSRVDLDSLEPDHRRNANNNNNNVGNHKEGNGGGRGPLSSSKPLPPPPPLSPPPPSCLSDCTAPPPPPPLPPKVFGKIMPMSRSNGGRRKNRIRKRMADDLHIGGAYAWSVTSSMYWKLLVVLQVVFSMADVVHDGTIMLYYQRIFLVFLFSTAIVIIIGMYVYTMYTKSPSPMDIDTIAAAASAADGNVNHYHHHNHHRHDRHYGGDAESGIGRSASLSSTLRRAYIRRRALCRTNFHLRLGAVVFGIATLIYYGFEIAVNTTNRRGSVSCVDSVVFALPIVLVVLCFLQIHFLFVNSQVLVGSLRGPAQFCFAHLLAANLVLWFRMIGSQSAMRWVTYNDGTTNDSRSHRFIWPPPEQLPVASSSARGEHEPPVAGGTWWTSASMPPEFERIAAFAGCLHNTTLGQMWLQATPFLVPFLLQFCVVSAAVFYVLWSSMSQSADRCATHGDGDTDVTLCRKVSVATQCQMENKGIFVGLLLLVGGIVVLVMYLILRAEPQFVDDSLWVVSGTLCIVLAVATLTLLFGFLRMQGVAYARDAPPVSHLDTVLTSATSAGPLLYSVLGLVSSASHMDTNDDVLVTCHSGLLLIEVFLQNVFVAERWRRMPNRAGQQMIQVMLFANLACWLLDTFMTCSGDSQKLQERFYGPLLWGVLSYSATPLIALYRFHATIQLYELWKRSHT